MEDVRAVMHVDFVNANDSWKISVPKIVDIKAIQLSF